MNWITKIIKAGEKIKSAIHKRATKEDIANSDWTSCCRGPILKKNLEQNLWVCPDCNKHHRINPKQRFDILFGMNNYEILKTPITKPVPAPLKPVEVPRIDVGELIKQRADDRAAREKANIIRDYGAHGLGHLRLKFEGLDD